VVVRLHADGAEAPSVSRPRGVPGEQVRAGIIPAIQKMDEVIGRCEAAVGSDVKILDHPILGPLTVMQWRKLHLVHGNITRNRFEGEAGKVSG